MNELSNRKHLSEWILLWHSFETLYFRFLREYDLSLNSLHIMTLLQRNPNGLEPAAIADTLGILRQAVTPLLNHLENRNLIIRENTQPDRRKKLIILSSGGELFVQEVEAKLSALEMQAFSKQSEEELSQMFNSLNHLHDNLSLLIHQQSIKK